jgi:hypothetical protein
MRFGTANVRGLYRSGFLKTVSRELAKLKLNVGGTYRKSDVQVKDDEMDGACSAQAGDIVDTIMKQRFS